MPCGVCSQEKLCHQSVKCTGETQFEQRQWLISSLHPVSLHNRPIIHSHLSAPLSDGVVAINTLLWLVYFWLRNTLLFSPTAGIHLIIIPELFLKLNLSLSRDKLLLSPWENPFFEAPLGTKMVLPCILSSFYVRNKSSLQPRQTWGARTVLYYMPGLFLRTCWLFVWFQQVWGLVLAVFLCPTCRYDPCCSM